MWSIGVILHLLLKGQVPYNGLSKIEILNSMKINLMDFSGFEWFSMIIIT